MLRGRFLVIDRIKMVFFMRFYIVLFNYKFFIFLEVNFGLFRELRVRV